MQEDIMEKTQKVIRSSKTLAGPFPPFHTDAAGEYPHSEMVSRCPWSWSAWTSLYDPLHGRSRWGAWRKSPNFKRHRWKRLVFCV